MTPRFHANGLPWLIWIGTATWACRGCGGNGSQAAFSDVPSFAHWAGDLKRAHAHCGPPVMLRAGQVGHPLNPDREMR